MESELLKTVGQVAGVGGIALGVVLLVFRDVLAKVLSVSRKDSFRLARLALILVWSIGLVGLALWAYVTVQPPREDPQAQEYEHGMNSFNIGKYESAVDYLRRIPSSSPKFRQAKTFEGNALIELGRYPEALSAHQVAVASAKTERERLASEFNIALSYSYAQDYDQALKHFEVVAKSAEFGRDADVIYNTAFVRKELGDVEGAGEMLSRFQFPETLPASNSARDILAKAYWLRANLYLRSANPDCTAARPDIDRVTEIAPYLSASLRKDTYVSKCSESKAVTQ